MLRSPSVSSVSPVPSCGTQDPPLQMTLNGAGTRLPPRVNVEFAGLTKSAWKRQSFQVGFVPISVNGFGAPEGGWFDPSRSAGMSWSSVGPSMPVLMIVAGVPLSIADRSIANGCGPRKAVPDELNTFMLM